MASKQTLTVREALNGDQLAEQISNQYMEWDNFRTGWVNEKKEVREYIFATDTSRTSNAANGWKNTTHIPKLCQIRDNLYANYISAIFPHDRAIKWEGDDRTGATKKKRQAVEAYIENKVRLGGFVPEVEKCIYDFIDYGNAFGLVEYVNETTKDALTGEEIQGYVGPKFRRVSPLDIVFNPVAATFRETPKIIRSIMTLGALRKEVSSSPEKQYLEGVFDRIMEVRHKMKSAAHSDYSKGEDFQIAGFANYLDYFNSQYVEVLDFYGDIYDEDTDEFLENQVISVVDRSYILRKEANPSWLGASTLQHVGWRSRQDNLYAMGPLDNLLGMQYRIDHLENAKADAMDLIIHPVMKIRGFVEDFDYGPGERIYVGDDGDVDFMRPDTTVLVADNQIAIYENKMEEMAGAPKQAMGFRTPGEKTAFEVQILENGSNKIFLNKTSYFERIFLEPILNSMLEAGRRLMGPSESIRQVDEDFNVTAFRTITREDITAKGKLRPIGARHFARNANILQNLVQLSNTPLLQDPKVASHISGKGIAKLVEELLDLEKFDLVRDNVAVEETLETQQLASQAQQMLMESQPDQMGPPDENNMGAAPQGPPRAR